MNTTAAPSTTVSDLLAALQDDIRHVHVRVTAAVGVAAVFITQIPLNKLQKEPLWARACSVAGLVVLLCSAASYFQYTQQLNKLRLRIVAERLERDGHGSVEAWREWMSAPAKSFWRHPWEGSRLEWRPTSIRFYRFGQLLLLVGTVLVGVVLGHLILK